MIAIKTTGTPRQHILVPGYMYVADMITTLPFTVRTRGAFDVFESIPARGRVRAGTAYVTDARTATAGMYEYALRL